MSPRAFAGLRDKIARHPIWAVTLAGAVIMALGGGFIEIESRLIDLVSSSWWVVGLKASWSFIVSHELRLIHRTAARLRVAILWSPLVALVGYVARQAVRYGLHGADPQELYYIYSDPDYFTAALLAWFGAWLVTVAGLTLGRLAEALLARTANRPPG